MININKLIINIFFTDINAGGGADLYIDPLNGSDLNDGTGSMDNAIKTFDKLNDIVAEGMTIEVKRGTRFEVDMYPIDLPFSGGLTSANYPDYLPIAIGNGNESKWNNVTIKGEAGQSGRYIIDGRILFPNASITKTAGRTNIYEYTFPKVQNSTYNYGGIWEDDVYLFEVLVNRTGGGSQTPNEATEANALTTLDTNAGYFYADFTSNPSFVTYYWHPVSSDDPIINGKDYRARHTDFAFARQESVAPTVRENIFKILDADFYGFANHNGALYGGNVDAENCRFIQPARHGLIVHGEVTDCEVRYESLMTWGGYAYHAFSLYSGAESLPITYTRCLAYYAEAGYPGTSAFGSHQQTGSNNSTITVQDCTTINAPRLHDYQEPINEVISMRNSASGEMRGLFSMADTGPNRTIFTLHDETFISTYITPASDMTITDGSFLMTSSRFTSSQYKPINISNNNGGTIEIRDTIINLGNSSNAWPLIRLVGGGVNTTIRLLRCVIINSDLGTPDILTVASGDTPIIDIQNCYFFDFEFLGANNVAAANALNSGFALNNIMEWTGSETNPLTGDPFADEWGLSGNAIGIIDTI